MNPVPSHLAPYTFRSPSDVPLTTAEVQIIILQALQRQSHTSNELVRIIQALSKEHRLYSDSSVTAEIRRMRRKHGVRIPCKFIGLFNGAKRYEYSLGEPSTDAPSAGPRMAA